MEDAEWSGFEFNLFPLKINKSIYIYKSLLIIFYDYQFCFIDAGPRCVIRSLVPLSPLSCYASFFSVCFYSIRPATVSLISTLVRNSSFPCFQCLIFFRELCDCFSHSERLIYETGVRFPYVAGAFFHVIELRVQRR